MLLCSGHPCAPCSHPCHQSSCGCRGAWGAGEGHPRQLACSNPAPSPAACRRLQSPGNGGAAAPSARRCHRLHAAQPPLCSLAAALPLHAPRLLMIHDALRRGQQEEAKLQGGRGAGTGGRAGAFSPGAASATRPAASCCHWILQPADTAASARSRRASAPPLLPRRAPLEDAPRLQACCTAAPPPRPHAAAAPPTSAKQQWQPRPPLLLLQQQQPCPPLLPPLPPAALRVPASPPAPRRPRHAAPAPMPPARTWREGSRRPTQASMSRAAMSKRGEMAPVLFRRPTSSTTILPLRWLSTNSNSPMYPGQG